MNHNENEITFNAENKYFQYLSTKKLEKAYLSNSVPGLSLSAGIPSGPSAGIGVSAHEKAIRKQLTTFGHFLQNQGLITYESEPAVGKYYLARAILTCGNMWPWREKIDNLDQVAWWIGDSADCTIFAYGSAENLCHANYKSSNKSTWWPSDAGTHVALLESITLSVESADNELSISNDLKISVLKDYCFNDAVHRSSYIVEPGLYEILMRVDGIEHGEEARPIVYGSPLWVASVTQPIPGTYEVDYDEASDTIATAAWDGKNWYPPRWITASSYSSGVPENAPEIKTSLPEIPLFHSFKLPSPPPTEIPVNTNTSWIGNLIRRLFNR